MASNQSSLDLKSVTLPNSGQGLGPGGRRRGGGLRKKREKKEERRARRAINVSEAIKPVRRVPVGESPSPFYEHFGSPSVRSHNRSNLEFSGGNHVRFQPQSRRSSPKRLALPARSLAPRPSPRLLLPPLTDTTISSPSRKSSRCPTKSNTTSAAQITLRQRNY